METQDTCKTQIKVLEHQQKMMAAVFGDISSMASSINSLTNIGVNELPMGVDDGATNTVAEMLLAIGHIAQKVGYMADKFEHELSDGTQPLNAGADDWLMTPRYLGLKTEAANIARNGGEA